MTVRYEVGDTRAVTATLATGSVALIASSPPFIALRSYLPENHPDKHAEIGSEPDPATFLDTLLALTAEWGRVLAPWGSIAIELGDTYAGTYSPIATSSATGPRPMPGSDRCGTAWPRAKSLALIPQLYATSLAYGRNILRGVSPTELLDVIDGWVTDGWSGAEAVAMARRWLPTVTRLDAPRFEPWLVRNVIVWHRPNPAVGALGDKVRPSTSYITVATRSAKRWFDLDAVRGDVSAWTAHYAANDYPGSERAVAEATKDGARSGGLAVAGDLAGKRIKAQGAPPLDCWFDHHDTWTLTTQPSRVSTTTTEQVPCGPDDGGERTTSPDCPVHGDRPAQAPTEPGDERAGASSPHTPCTGSRPEPEQPPAGDCGASTSTRSDQPAASARSTSSSRTAPAPSTSQPDTPSAQTAARTGRTPASPESSGGHPDTPESNSGEVCPPADEPETALHSDRTSDPSSACTCSFHLVKTSVHSHYAMWPAKLAERLILMMCPAEVCATCGEGRRRVTSEPVGVGGLHQAANGGSRTLGGHPNGHASQMGARSVTTLGWSDCGHGDYRPGVILDPFCGSGTTMAAAEFHGRDAIGIDLDARNRDLYPRRREEVFRALNPTHVRQAAGQMGLFGEVVA